MILLCKFNIQLPKPQFHDCQWINICQLVQTLQYMDINLFSDGIPTDESRENYREAIYKVMRQLLRECFI